MKKTFLPLAGVAVFASGPVTAAGIDVNILRTKVDDVVELNSNSINASLQAPLGKEGLALMLDYTNREIDLVENSVFGLGLGLQKKNKSIAFQAVRSSTQFNNTPIDSHIDYVNIEASLRIKKNDYSLAYNERRSGVAEKLNGGIFSLGHYFNNNTMVSLEAGIDDLDKIYSAQVMHRFKNSNIGMFFDVMQTEDQVDTTSVGINISFAGKKTLKAANRSKLLRNSVIRREFNQ